MYSGYLLLTLLLRADISGTNGNQAKQNSRQCLQNIILEFM